MKVGDRWIAAAVVVAAALVVPAAGSAAGSATVFKAAVVAKDPARKAVVTASAGGVVRTLRGAMRLEVGQSVGIRAKKLRDGTFRAQKLTLAGRAHRVQLRGVLIRHQAGRYLISAGGSMLAVRGSLARRTAAAAVTGAKPGDRVLLSASVTNGSLTATKLTTLGHAATTEVEGIFLGISSTGQVRLAVVGKGEVLVAVPAGVTLPALTPGDEVKLNVSVDTAGALTLVSVSTAVGDDEDDQGEDNDDQGEDDNGATTTTTTTTQPTTTTTSDDQGDDNDDQGDDD